MEPYILLKGNYLLIKMQLFYKILNILKIQQQKSDFDPSVLILKFNKIVLGYFANLFGYSLRESTSFYLVQTWKKYFAILYLNTVTFICKQFWRRDAGPPSQPRICKKKSWHLLALFIFLETRPVNSNLSNRYWL